MTAARAFLVDALRRVAGGGDIAEAELDTAVPDPLSLDKVEKLAWQQLSHWAEDADIREKDSRYAASKREWMRHYLDQLTGSRG